MREMKDQKHAYTQHELGVQDAKNEGDRNHKRVHR